MAPDHDKHHEGPEAARRAESLLRRVLQVPKDELKRREAEYQKEREEKRETRKRKLTTDRP